MKVLNDLLGYENLQLYQDDTMFSFTLDSILLARFINFNKRITKIVDFGTNNGVIPLIISRYTTAAITGVEINPQAVSLAQENMSLNNLDHQVTIVKDDIKVFAQKHIHGFDVVICNPPFFEVGEKTKTRATSPLMVDARHETLINLAEIIQSASLCLNNKGVFVMVHRAQRTGEIIELFSQHHLVVKRLRFVYSKSKYEAKTVLIEGQKQGNKGVKILPPLIAHNDDETYSDEILEFFRD